MNFNSINQITSQQLLNFVVSQHRQNLHADAFKEISNVFLSFYNACQGKKADRPHWVCDAAPGHGKTTALIAFLKWLSTHNERKDIMPVLLAMRDTEHMQKAYDELLAFRSDEYFVKYIDKDTDIDEEQIKDYQVVIISHQRLKNLACEIGNVDAYSKWLPKGNKKRKARALIVDEMPAFHDSVIFDVGDSDNAVGWFDNFAKLASLSVAEKTIARSAIAIMIAKETISNQTIVTKALRNQLADTGLYDDFMSIYSRINPKLEMPEDINDLNKNRWFHRLLLEDGVGRLDAHRFGRRIICGKRIDYRTMGMPILILDGSSNLTPLQYNGEYQIQHVRNRHNYDRLHLQQKVINTSSEKRQQKDKSVQKTIANDILELSKANRVFPLVAKGDINTYSQLGVINEDYKELYFKGVVADDADEKSLPINLLNTTGKNHLQNESFLYLTNLPILHPEYYKQLAICLYDNDQDKVGLELAEKGEGSWFRDEKIEALYHECLLAELVQIVHRSNIRQLNSNLSVHVTIATKNRTILQKLKDALVLSDENYHEDILFNDALYGFGEKCQGLAKRWVAHGKKNRNSKTKCFPCTIGIIDENDKKFVNNHWQQEDKRKILQSVLAEYGLQIVEGANGYKKVDWLNIRKESVS